MRDVVKVCHIGDGVGVPPEMYRKWVGWGVLPEMYREEAVELFVCEE